MPAPRRSCPVCTRDIAVVGGRLARHDRPGRRSGTELVSCPGSLRVTPLAATQPALMDLGHPAGQLPLF